MGFPIANHRSGEMHRIEGYRTLKRNPKDLFRELYMTDEDIRFSNILKQRFNDPLCQPATSGLDIWFDWLERQPTRVITSERSTPSAPSTPNSEDENPWAHLLEKARSQAKQMAELSKKYGKETNV